MESTLDLLSITLILIYILISILVTLDARNNSNHPMIWGVSVFITGLFGLVLYLLFGRNKSKNEETNTQEINL